MRVWLVKFEETLPTDPNPRLYRMGMLAEALHASGHEVVWWASTYDHQVGRLRSPRDTVYDHGVGYQIRLLHTVSGYSRAVSGARVLNNLRQAWRLRAAATAAPPPDIIVCAMPTPELAWVSAGLGERYGVPVVLDARDMWPDIFAELLSPAMRLAAWPYVKLMRVLLGSAARRAAACTAITEPFLDWIVGYAGRPRRDTDRAFPLGYQEPRTSAVELAEAEVTLPAEMAGAFNVVFLGRLNRTVLNAFDPVLQAARLLRAEARPFRFYFAGTGDCADVLRARATDLPEIVFLGQIRPPALAALKRRGHAALLCIARRRDYQISLSNKVFDYLAAGLPLVSHLTGLVGQLVKSEHCGFVYDDGEGLASGLRGLAADEDRRRSLGRNARRVFEEHYDASRLYPRMAEYVITLASSRFCRVGAKRVPRILLQR